MIDPRKIILLAVFISLLAPLSFAQMPGFQKIFGQAEKREFGVASVQLNEEYIYLLGYESSTETDTEGTLSKLDFQGQLLWTADFGTRNDDIPRDILLNDQGELIVVGETQISGASQVNAFVFKFDTSGTQKWAEIYDNDSGNTFFNNIKQTADGGYIVCGFTSGQGFGNDYYLVKMDVDGNVEWDRAYGGPNNEIGVAVEVLEDGSYIFVGDKQQSEQGPYGIELTSIDASGNIRWQKDINDFANGGCKSMIRNRAGKLVIVGEATPPNQFAFDIFVAEVSTDGEIAWQRFVEASPKSDAGFGIMELTDGSGYLVTGYSHNESTDDTDIVISQLDPLGNELRRQYYENPGVGIGYDIKPVGNTSFIASGYATQDNTPQYFITLNNYLITSTPAIKKETLELQLFPNPISAATSLLQLSYPLKNASVQIINSSGLTVSSNHYETLASIDLTGFPAGVYWIRLQTENGSIHKKIIKF